MMKNKLSTLDIKNKIVILKTNDRPDEKMVESLCKLGALGLITLTTDQEITSLGEKELQNILDHMKKAKAEDNE